MNLKNTVIISGLICCSLTILIYNYEYRNKIEIFNNKLKKIEKEIINEKNKYEKLIEKYEKLIEKYEKLNIEYEGQNKKINELKNKIDKEKLHSFNKVIFNPNNLKELSGVSEKQLSIVFKLYDEYKELQGLEKSIIEVEKKYGVNALFVLGIISQETGYNTSNRAVNDNNMGGIQVYNNNSKGMVFENKNNSILYIGHLLSKEYLNVNGKYYRGLDIYSVNENYCITPKDKYSWANNIINICSKYVARINELN